MGIYDRDYYRGEGHSILDSFMDRGRMCKWLVLINVIVFVIQLVTQQQKDLPREFDERAEELLEIYRPLDRGPFTDALVLNTDKVLQGQIWRLITHAFLHDPGTPWHIILNMLIFWYFGTDVEDIYGSKEFLALYLASAFIGGMAFVLGNLAGVPGPQCLGASGCVMTVVMICACHYPTRTILMFCFLPLPIWFFLILVLAPDAYLFLNALVHHTSTGGTAVTVHLAGAAFGYAYYKKQWRVLNLWPAIASLRRPTKRPRLRVYREEEAPQPVPVAAPPQATALDEQLEAQVDAVLEKVSRSGRESLTDTERELLRRASEVYKKKRT